MTWSAAAALAKKQRGVVTREQLGRLGLSLASVKWALRTGTLARVLRGAYRFTLTPQTWQQRATAALLVCGEGAVLSHETAAHLWRLHCVERKSVGVIHVTVPRDRSVELPEGYVVHRPIRAVTAYRLDELPVTRLARTLVDLAGELDPLELEQTMDEAQLRRGQLKRWLEQELVGLKPRAHPGLGTLLKLLEQRKGGRMESWLETRIRQRLRARKIEEDRPQYEISDERGVIMRVDQAWVAERVVVHGDSYLWHGDRKSFDRDALQRSRLAAAGWIWLSVTKTSVEDDLWLDQLEQLLKQRSPQLDLFSADVKARSGLRAPTATPPRPWRVVM